MKRWLSVGVLVIFVITAVIYFWNQPDLIEVLTQVSLSTIIFLTLIRLLFLVTNGLFLNAFASKFNIQLRFIEWVGLPFVTSFGNYVTPFSGGLVARAAYLKKRHDFAYSSFATLMASNYLINFWVIGFVGITATILVPKTDQINSLLIGVWFLGVVVVVSLLFLMPAVKFPGNNRISRLVDTSLAGWQLIKQDKQLVIKLTVFSMINILLNTFAFWLAYRAIGESVSFLSVLLISMLSSFSILINITPANLGISEAVITLASTLLGTGVGTGLIVALLIRATTVLVVFTLGPIFSYLLTKELTNQPANEHLL